MMWTAIDTWIVVTGALAAAACALPGAFLVLRRMSLLGDAISHAVLPGLAVAFLVSGSRHSLIMFAGAAVAGLLTAVLADSLSRTGKVEEGAALGVVFTTLFAAGLVLIVRAADRVDLDPGCVLYGALELAPLDTVRIGGWDLPRAALINGAALLVNVAVLLVFFKEVRICAFDPAQAVAQGIPARWVHRVQMMLVAVTTVAAFESVGSILVVAMLIVPAAAAHLLTDRLAPLLALSAGLAVLAAVIGHIAAITVPPWFGVDDTITSGCMAVAAGFLFLAALLFAPRHGLLARAWHRAALARRIVEEDVLGQLFRGEERQAQPAEDPVAAIQHPHRALRNAMHRLRRRGWIEGVPPRLTASGRRHAAELLRSHRLWESYLHADAGIAPDHVHASAERLEHVTSPGLRVRLAERLDHPARDPHGHPIP